MERKQENEGVFLPRVFIEKKSGEKYIRQASFIHKVTGKEKPRKVMAVVNELNELLAKYNEVCDHYEKLRQEVERLEMFAKEQK